MTNIDQQMRDDLELGERVTRWLGADDDDTQAAYYRGLSLSRGARERASIARRADAYRTEDSR